MNLTRPVREDGNDRDRAIRRVLEAAADAGEPRDPPPFFVARVRARAAAGAGAVSSAHPVGLAALQMLPALGVAVMCLAAWTGYQTLEAAREAEAVVDRTLGSPEALDEAIVVALILGEGDR